MGQAIKGFPQPRSCIGAVVMGKVSGIVRSTNVIFKPADRGAASVAMRQCQRRYMKGKTDQEHEMDLETKQKVKNQTRIQKTPKTIGYLI